MGNSAEPGVVRRAALSYAGDLLVTIVAVLICGRLLMPWPSVFADHAALPYIVADAIDRFTPISVWHAYQDNVLDVVQAYIRGGAAGPMDAAWITLQLAGSLLLSIPNTIVEIFQESDGIYTWGCLAAFVVTFAAFVVSFSGRRPSLLRMVLAGILAPVLTSMVFWLAEQTLIDAVNALGWFERMIPWCLPCPVLCTLWWMCFPRAPHGAVGTLLLNVHQGWVTLMRRRRRIRTELVGSRPH
jgi:hypothetical protein